MSESRVAIQLVSTGGLYGAERALLELAGYLRDRGWASHVVALEGRGAAEIVSRASAEGLPSQAFVTGGRMRLLPLLSRLRRLLADHSRAIVHSHGYKPDLLLGLLKTHRRLACVATCHSWYSETFKLKLLEAADKRILRTFDHVVAVAPEIRAALLASGVPASRVTLINNGISMTGPAADARQHVRAEFDLPADCRILVQIGRLARSKRNDLLISAMGLLRNPAKAHLLLVGEGELRGQLAEQAVRGGLARQVHFCGYRRDAVRLLAAADALVLSSDKEGLPITILEGMATRCPIVSTDVGAIADVLVNNQGAVIVPANDAVALAAAIDEVLDNPAAARMRAENAFRRFTLEYSREAMGRRYLRIYENAWAARGWG